VKLWTTIHCTKPEDVDCAGVGVSWGDKWLTLLLGRRSWSLMLKAKGEKSSPPWLDETVKQDSNRGSSTGVICQCWQLTERNRKTDRPVRFGLTITVSPVNSCTTSIDYAHRTPIRMTMERWKNERIDNIHVLSFHCTLSLFEARNNCFSQINSLIN